MSSYTSAPVTASCPYTFALAFAPTRERFCLSTHSHTHSREQQLLIILRPKCQL